jgi:hypothetical protein
MYGHPVLYPADGGNQSVTRSNASAPSHPTPGGNNGYSISEAVLKLMAAAADDDPRAVLRFEEAESYFWDYMLPYSIGYTTGFQRSGAHYSYDRTMPEAALSVLWLTNSVVGFPDLGVTGAWVTRPVMQKSYSLLPDPVAGYQYPAPYGADSGNAISQMACGYPVQPTGRLAPASNEAGYYQQFWSKNTLSESICPVTILEAQGDPTIAPLDYTTLPTQYLFRATSQSVCTSLGMNCPATTRGDGVVSRTGWSSPGDTHILFHARTYANDHDLPQGGELDIHKRGPLVGNGSLYMRPTDGDANSAAYLGGILEFGGTTNNLHSGPNSDGSPATAFIDRWAGVDPTGDGQSRYVYAEADVAGMYSIPIKRAKVHVLHFKKPGAEEIVMQYFDVDVSGSPTAVRGQIHYPQNGEAATPYYSAEGTTGCPGDSNCASLNTNRTILSQQSGSGFNTNGVVTRIFSPSNIFVRWDGSSYAGGYGADSRVSICGGQSCGANVSSADWLVVHKVTSLLADNTLDASALSSDTRWTGVQTGGTVAMFSRGGVFPIAASFQSSHAGTAQYLIAGLEGGHTYRAYRREDAADAAILDVADGDNTLYFEAGAGTYAVFPVGLGNLFTGPRPPIRVRESLQYDFKVAGDSTSYIWTVSGGSLPPGLTLSANGVLSGTAKKSGQYTVTVRAQETGSSSGWAESSVTLAVTDPPITVRAVGAVGRGYLEYGSATLDALQHCTVTVSDRADFSTVVETLTDGGGAARRQMVAGLAQPLTAGTAYYARVACGNLTGSADFTTPAAGTAVAIQIPLSISVPSRIGAASVQVQYGDTPQLGSSVTAPCVQSCRVLVPGMSNTVIYWRRLFLDSSARVVAQSGIAPVVAPPGP